jgi:Flp pilus assembly protein TadG
LASRARRLAAIGNPALRRFLDETGATAVETAASMIVVMTLFLGLMEASWGLYLFNYTAEAAREGSRWAMVRGSSCSGFSGACPATATDVQAFVQSIKFPGTVAANTLVTTTWSANGVACSPSSTPCNNPGNLVTVKVQYAFPYTVPFIATNNLTFSSTSAMTVTQ